ncbi:hypothetical protein C943_00610 [Mariniradius saccharolyticus AK6]|uniref:Uncharacterized protein n=2 Tax=Mariniradius TaxID=1245590 RepID=M7XXX9_9BACT|nr:hypothetical protein C943_00610 [Mariniradius saccharolyticus AK6]
MISACTPREKLVVHQVIKNFPNVTVIHPDSKTTTSAGRKAKQRNWDFWGRKIINFLRKKTIEKSPKMSRLHQCEFWDTAKSSRQQHAPLALVIKEF